jgi:hypothetical protein
MRLKPSALGVALGAVWGVSLFVTTWISFYTGYAALFLEALAKSIYPGYSVSPLGSFLGLGYGFLDGLVSGTLIGWLYNRLAKG